MCLLTFYSFGVRKEGDGWREFSEQSKKGERIKTLSLYFPPCFHERYELQSVDVPVLVSCFVSTRSFGEEHAADKRKRKGPAAIEPSE